MELIYMSMEALKNRLGNKVQGGQSIFNDGRNPFINPSNQNNGSVGSANEEPNNDSMSAVEESNDTDVENLSSDVGGQNGVAIDVVSSKVIESDYLALTTNAIDIINENLKNQPLSPALFDIIKAPTGGFTAFNVPGINGDEIEKELVGIILDYTAPRAYWNTPEPVEGTPPTCYSLDSIVSVEGKLCSTCAYNTFGSKDGDSQAKACKESIQAFLLRPDSIIPVIVRIPVTSKFIFQKYMTRLVGRMIPLNGVVTKITLEKATSNGGQPYAKFNFEAVNLLSQDEAAYARAYGTKFSEMLSSSHDIQDSIDYHSIDENGAK
jgi:hypothetical protein